jgi:GAF domain-containing protein
MGTSGWSTQQLAEFVAAVAAAESEASAAITAVERAAEALDAAVAAIICDGRLIAAIGYPDGAGPVGELEAVEPGIEGSALGVPGVGECSAAAAPLEHPPGATAREEVERLAQDQAALRRVATLVARAAPRQEIYAAVAAEIAQRLGADVVAVLRYEANTVATVVGAWGVAGLQISIGAELSVEGEGVASSVWRTREPARIERFHGPPGSVADTFRNLGVHTGVGSPIVVDDELWGVAFAATARQDALPAGSEARIAEFTQLVAAAIANAEARGELRRIANVQTALRRVATLVARGESAGEVFDAVTSETRQILDFEATFLYRLEPDGVVIVVAADATLPTGAAVGDRWTPVPGGVVERVLQTGRPARIDGLDDEPGSFADRLREFGYGGAAAAPIVVEGRLWGVMSAAWARGRSVPAGSEDRLIQFSELIATALANAQAREELRRVAEEQAALRRVATLVARGEPPSAVFAAVAAEVGCVIPIADVAYVGRYDHDGAIEFVGAWSPEGEPSFVGSRVALGGHNVATLVFEGNEPARVDRIPDDHTPATALARNWARSSAGAPINVEGRLWGVMTVGVAREDELPPGTEYTLAQFTELVATAIANAQAREELRLVANEQAALRRVATLVARAAPAAEVFATVAEEVGRFLSVDAAAVRRCHADADEIVGAWSSRGEVIPVGFRRPAVSGTVTATVRETRRPARVDWYSAETGRAAREMGIRSSVAVPITVEGGLWGLIAVVSTSEEPPPPGPRNVSRGSPNSSAPRSRMPRLARSCARSPMSRPPYVAWRRWSLPRRRPPWSSRPSPRRLGGCCTRITRTW